jgi:Ring hydroxylating beta subunit
VSPEKFHQLLALYADYAAVLDAADWQRWPEFFTADCRYRIQPRENFDQGNQNRSQLRRVPHQAERAEHRVQRRALSRCGALVDLSDMSWIDVAAQDDLFDGASIAVTPAGHDIALHCIDGVLRLG